tara:strand:- start:20 stop:313 length:294 start_codon:yes stop_codon:yes gene_type:complete
MKSEYFDCKCNDIDHVLRFTYDDVDKELYCEINLNSELTFCQRFIRAFKYLFKFKTKYGYYSNWILKDDDIERLEELLNKNKKNKNVNMVGTMSTDI